VNPREPQRSVNIDVEVRGIDPPVFEMSLTSEAVIVTGSGPNDWEPFPEASGGPQHTTHYQRQTFLQSYHRSISYNVGLRLRIHLSVFVDANRLHVANVSISLTDGPSNVCGPRGRKFTEPGVLECILITRP
jgi:hypothetical protein